MTPRVPMLPVPVRPVSVCSMRSMMVGMLHSAMVVPMGGHLQKHCLQCPPTYRGYKLARFLPERCVPEDSEAVLSTMAVLVAVQDACLKETRATGHARHLRKGRRILPAESDLL